MKSSSNAYMQQSVICSNIYMLIVKLRLSRCYKHTTRGPELIQKVLFFPDPRNKP